MPRFNYTKARNDGLTDEEIFEHLEDARKNGIALTLDRNEVESYRTGTVLPAENPLEKNKIMAWASKAFEATGRNVGGLILGVHEGVLEATTGKTVEELGRKRVGFDILARGERPAPSAADIAFGALELTPGMKPLAKAAVAPVRFAAEQIAKIPGVEPATRVAGRAVVTTGKNLIKSVAEVFTGIREQDIRKWFQWVRNAPERVQRAKAMVEKAPQAPHLALADDIAGRLNETKRGAKEAFDTAVQTAKESAPNARYNLDTKVPALNLTLQKWNLRVDQVRGTAGEFITDIVVVPTTRTSPFTQRPKQLQQLTEIVRKMRAKDMTIDELLDFDKSVKQFFDDVVRTEDKSLMALGAALISDASKFVDDALPAVHGANQQYRAYYEAMEKLGNRIVDTEGNVKRGAETYLANLGNLNKGAERRAAEEASKALGMDIFGDADAVRIARNFSENIPTNVKDRTGAVIRGVLASTAARAAAGGAGGALSASGREEYGIPLLLLAAFSSPKMYGNIIELIAGSQRRLSAARAASQLTDAERALITTIMLRPALVGAEQITRPE